MTLSKVRVDSISPATDYGNDEEHAYDFEIAGENLAPVASDNMIEVVGRGPQPVGDAAECDAYAVSRRYDKLCLSYRRDWKAASYW